MNILKTIISIFTKKPKDFIVFKKLGQLALDKKERLEVDTFVGKDFVLHSGNNVILNAGNETFEIRVGNKNKIKISRDRIDITSDTLYLNDKLIT